MNKIIILLLLISTSIQAQKNVNNYKYIMVPNKFDFLKTVDQYQTSSLTKFLFKKHGFTVFLADEVLPDDLAENRCLALTAVLTDASSLFTTKNSITLKDCGNKDVFSSKEGRSKIKNYKKSYHEAIRNAFKSIKALKYKYTPNSTQNIIQNIDNQSELLANKTVESTVINLYAQPTKNGFQLVDTTQEIIFKILKTSVKDVFAIKDKNGIIHKNNDIWIAEYYKKGIKKTEKYQVKF
ncbi:hypothetical protein G1L02_11250 [Tenacibaculum finnmarkense]|uniref:hypothetical protein n=1 Tax=Tenacibaculum finnmarkense TaxID=2781243 RepID=UPI00187B770C|nr:hypothetical protein [Tenacibaculum finnmarkense]MBE7648983.1 hypothetical protein [Tenacibaculum finnmarkense genomovar ulcerans]MBE7688865.1 hypothetical protein [Tenacibaculum finnmarkense genomovar ulcerans]MCD8433282.1 hypothetical protein [Tenacibaculum finnmarkense genomovar ulcerans]MCG8734572.1 hypothetical protein [Tenacibaculum finnmarkense]MCG8750260.1 hypothetical protein [Tenacibaculum finnmarkense]